MIWIKDLARILAEEKWWTIIDNEEIILDIINVIKDKIEGWNKVNLKWFGRFCLTKRKARRGSNPYTWKPIEIAARTSLKFETSIPYHKAIKDINI